MILMIELNEASSHLKRNTSNWRRYITLELGPLLGSTVTLNHVRWAYLVRATQGSTHSNTVVFEVRWFIDFCGGEHSVKLAHVHMLP